MTGLWPGSGVVVANATAIASNAATSKGTTLTSDPSTTYTMGAWTQLIAATVQDANWAMFIIQIPRLTSGSTGTAVAVDVGCGAGGSEIEIVPNLSCSAFNVCVATYFLPLAIPAGTRLAARASSNVLSDSCTMQVLLFDDAYGSAGAGSSVDNYGFFTSLNIGTQVDAGGAANLKGPYFQIVASTTNDISGFFLAYDTQNLSGSASVTAIAWLLDISIGAAASEVVILPNLSMAGYFQTTSTEIFNNTSPYYAIPIPAGTRIAARAQCSSAVTPERFLGLTFWGVRR